MSPGKKWARAALALVVAGSLGGVAWVLWRMSERDSRLPKLALTLPEERERARCAALPQTDADLPPRPTLRESENAAPLYREAVNLLPLWELADRTVLQRVLERRVRLKPDEEERVKKLLAAAAPALTQVTQGTQRSGSDFGWHGELTEDDWKQRREVLLGCDRLARLCLVQAQRADDPAARLAWLTRQERLTRHLTAEPGLLVWQLRGLQAALAIPVLDTLADEHPELVGQVEPLLERWTPPSGVLKRAWWMQCVKERDDAQRSRQKPYKTDDEPFLDYNPLWRELDRLDHRLGWTLYADATEVINLGYWRRVKQALAPLPDQDLAAQWRALRALDVAEDRRAKAFAGYWFPQRYSGIAAQLVSIELQRRLLALARALRRYEQAHGSFPETLEALETPLSLQDPFSQKPLRWKAPILYSVGGDEKDDGGERSRDIVLDVSKAREVPGLRGRRGAMRRPGRLSGALE